MLTTSPPDGGLCKIQGLEPSLSPKSLQKLPSGPQSQKTQVLIQVLLLTLLNNLRQVTEPQFLVYEVEMQKHLP
jgi:hypothetical protein